MSQASNPKEVSQKLFPTEIPSPLFALGTNVCWKSISSDELDCGLILGMRYVWSEHIQDWQYQYYIALDADSPSYQWAKFDWGWQEDLTLISTPNSSVSSEDKND